MYIQFIWIYLGIRVNSIQFGAITTDMTAAIPDEMKKANESKLPLKRFGEPEEAANAILFMASSDASYITASSMLVDGGHLAV
jgi:3-oxoacyl-[acyl-carrier protein] reductase